MKNKNRLNVFISIITLLITQHYAHAKPAYSPPPFCSTEILARPLSNGYTWTLTSRLGELLDRAEKLFGERDKSWTLLGVEFSTNNYPQTWYPGASENRKDIIIQLTHSSANNEKQATFQLAHEVIHLLSPNGKSNSSTVLEEGLATYFSIYIMQQIGYTIGPSYISSKSYEAAYRHVEKLIDKQSDAIQIIKLLRKNKTFTDIDAKTLYQHMSQITHKEAATLSENFQAFSRQYQ